MGLVFEFFEKVYFNKNSITKNPTINNGKMFGSFN